MLFVANTTGAAKLGRMGEWLSSQPFGWLCFSHDLRTAGAHFYADG
jgi:hypothetical protein